MFDPEKIAQWSKMAQKMAGQDFWTNVFNSPYSARFLEQAANLVSPQKNFPRADIYQTEREIIVLVDLPGVRKQDVQIQVADDRLVIKGIAPEPYSGCRLVSSERFTGNFKRSIPLPEPVGKAGYKAALRDGLLEIRLPRGFEAAFRTIPIDGDG
ncbi:MAG: Hsp20/alpha crystallin family protein [Bacillota bacterium]